MGPDIDMKFHQEVMEIVSYDISFTLEELSGDITGKYVHNWYMLLDTKILSKRILILFIHPFTPLHWIPSFHVLSHLNFLFPFGLTLYTSFPPEIILLLFFRYIIKVLFSNETSKIPCCL